MNQLNNGTELIYKSAISKENTSQYLKLLTTFQILFVGNKNVHSGLVSFICQLVRSKRDMFLAFLFTLYYKKMLTEWKIDILSCFSGHVRHP